MIPYRKLNRENQMKAIQNVLDQNSDLRYLAFLIDESNFDENVEGWFDFNASNEGMAYWYALEKELNEQYENE